MTEDNLSDPKETAHKSEEGNSHKIGISETWLSILIIALALAAAAASIRPLFQEGYLMNFDHPVHQGVIKCAMENPSWILTPTWCSFLQAGLPPFQSHPALFYHFVILLSSMIDFSLAYKVALILVLIAMPCLAAWILHRKGHSLAGAFAFALILLDHGSQDMTGIDFTIVGGSGFNQLMGYALFVAVLYYSTIVFEKPTRWRFSILALLTSAYFLAHPTTSLLYIPIFITLLIIYRESVKKKTWLFVLYPLIVLLTVSYFLLPMLVNLSSNDSGGLILGITSPWEAVYWKILVSMNSLAFIGGIIGIVLIGSSGWSSLWGIPALAAGIFAAWINYPVLSWIHLLDYSQFHRSVGIMHILILIGCAYTLEWAIRRASSLDRVRGLALAAIALLAFGAVIGDQYSVTSERAGYIVTSSQPLFQPLFSTMSGLNTTRGRVLYEETYGQTTYPVNLSAAWGIGPLYTTSDLIHPMLRSLQFPYAGTKDYQIQNQRIESLTRQDLLSVLEDWNIQYIVTGSGPYRSAFRFLPVHKTIGPFVVYENTATPVDYFRIGKGKVLSSDYRKTYAKAQVESDEFTNVIFKVRYWHNWEARIDGVPTEIQKSRQHLMIISVPEGKHVIEFEYGPRWWDYLGYWLTLAGLAVVAWWLFPKIIGMKPTPSNKAEAKTSESVPTVE